MKKLFYVMAACVLFIAACGGNNQKVQAFVESFAGYIENGQLDSIKAAYPTLNFDSFAGISLDSIQISDKDGVYHVECGNGQWIDVKEADGGNMYVEATRGVAQFPEQTLQMGISTGMIDDATTDVQIQERISDPAYIEWLKDKAQKEFQDGLAVEVKNKTGRMLGEGLYQITQIITVTNKTDHDISGNVYDISYKGVGANDSEKGGSVSYKKGTSGIDVKAGQSATKKLSARMTMKNPVAVLKMPIEEYIVNYYKPTGKEYQEYLDSKK